MYESQTALHIAGQILIAFLFLAGFSRGSWHGIKNRENFNDLGPSTYSLSCGAAAREFAASAPSPYGIMAGIGRDARGRVHLRVRIVG